MLICRSEALILYTEPKGKVLKRITNLLLPRYNLRLNMSSLPTFTALLLLAAFPATGAQSPDHLLLRDPAVSKTQICFEYANDLWIVSRDGG